MVADRLPGAGRWLDHGPQHVGGGVAGFHRLQFQREGARQGSVAGRVDRFRGTTQQDHPKRGVGQCFEYVRPDRLRYFVQAVQEPGHAAGGQEVCRCATTGAVAEHRVALDEFAGHPVGDGFAAVGVPIVQGEHHRHRYQCLIRRRGLFSVPQCIEQQQDRGGALAGARRSDQQYSPRRECSVDLVQRVFTACSQPALWCGFQPGQRMEPLIFVIPGGRQRAGHRLRGAAPSDRQWGGAQQSPVGGGGRPLIP